MKVSDKAASATAAIIMIAASFFLSPVRNSVEYLRNTLTDSHCIDMGIDRYIELTDKIAFCCINIAESIVTAFEKLYLCA